MSEVILDTITGKSTATTVTIGSTPVVSASANSMTIRGEGSNQTSIQQGLAKAWVNLNAYSFGSRDTFNVSSVTDNGTGDHTITINNDFGNANYSAVGCCIAGTGSDNNGQVVSSIGSSGHAPAGSLRFAVQYSSTQVKNDVNGISIQFHGDLS